MAFVGTLEIAPCVSFFKYTQTKLELRQIIPETDYTTLSGFEMPLNNEVPE